MSPWGADKVRDRNPRGDTLSVHEACTTNVRAASCRVSSGQETKFCFFGLHFDGIGGLY